MQSVQVKAFLESASIIICTNFFLTIIIIIIIYYTFGGWSSLHWNDLRPSHTAEISQPQPLQQDQRRPRPPSYVILDSFAYFPSCLYSWHQNLASKDPLEGNNRIQIFSCLVHLSLNSTSKPRCLSLLDIHWQSASH